MDFEKKDKARDWIIGIGIVEFDADLGQIVKYMYPEGVLTEQEQKSISHMSFPDSNAFTKPEGSSQYAFRVKRDKLDCGNRFCYGFTMFMQKKDSQISRGYKQQSVVVITVLPFINFFNSITQIVASFTFPSPDKVSDILKQVIDDMNKWPSPEGGKSYSLSLLNHEIEVGQGEERLIIPNYTRIEKAIESVHESQIEQNETNQKEKIESQQNKSNNQNLDGSHKNMNQDNSDNEQGENFKDHSNSKEESFSDKTLENKQEKSEIENQNQNVITLQKGDEPKKEQIVKKINGMESILSTFDSQVEGLFQEFNIFGALGREKWQNLWKLWEVALTNSPLMIITNSPEQCSSLVFGAISLISPLNYIGDYRPYFTIYDPDYKKIKDDCDNKITNNTILGVTNPFFLKTMPKYPLILRLDNAYEELSQNKSQTSSKQFLFEVNQKTSKLYINYDKQLQKMLLGIDTAEVSAINNSLIRKHFRTLTSQFMQTFDDYFAVQRNDIKIFDQKEFLKMLEGRKFPFSESFEKKKKIVSLYEKFLKSANFLDYIKTKKNVYFQKSMPRS